MKCFTFEVEGAHSSVAAWLHTGMCSEQKQGKSYPAVVICPGGGYEMVSEREAEPVAAEYFAAGYQTFILYYSIGEDAKCFKPLCQLASVMSKIRAHAQEWKVEEEHIAVCGFSAGGHLAASMGTLYTEPEFLKVWNRQENIRPDAMILSYPVITADEYAHEGSICRVSGAVPGTTKYAWFGLEQHVNKETPPTFLWHTAQDSCVPVENSLRFAAALSKVKVPFELHVFPEGEHGMSVCSDEVNEPNYYNARWIEWSVSWLNKQFSHIK